MNHRKLHVYYTQGVHRNVIVVQLINT
jgi:hypothetical protein